MSIIKLNCYHCGIGFYKTKQRVNESTKFGWNNFCSPYCLVKSKSKSKIFQCSNLKCNKMFKRKPSEEKHSKNFYCSRSCAVSINNKKFPKNPGVTKSCAICSKKFKTRKKYCSVECKIKGQTIRTEDLLLQLKKFYFTHKRIPVKREFGNYATIRSRFQTWNKAIIAAGFQPNKLIFTQKYLAIDRHVCDSFSEMLIDNWLYKNNIEHELHVPYGIKKYSADFKVDNVLIEFIGLEGKVKSYDRALKYKREFWKKNKLNVICIYPKDLYPISKLDNILKFSNLN